MTQHVRFWDNDAFYTLPPYISHKGRDTIFGTAYHSFFCMCTNFDPRSARVSIPGQHNQLSDSIYETGVATGKRIDILSSTLTVSMLIRIKE